MTRASAGESERMLNFYREMLRIRCFEEAAIEGLKEGLVLGAIHPSIGQEAVAVGVCANLEKRDVVLSTHRGHGHTLAKGARLEPMMRELFGREGGYCKGKGGSMHIADFSVGMLGSNGVVAANIVIATGAAHAIKLRRSGELVVCFFGDGAINRGPFLEGLNWAQVNRLPILFVCEDNGIGISVETPAGWIAAAYGTRPGLRWKRTRSKPRCWVNKMRVARRELRNCKRRRKPSHRRKKISKRKCAAHWCRKTSPFRNYRES